MSNLNAFVQFDFYKEYALFIDASLQDLRDVFKSCVRIDDLIISRVIEKFKSKKLNKFWSTKFDQAEIIRAIRLSLDNKAKIWMNVREMSVNERIVLKEEQGYFINDEEICIVFARMKIWTIFSFVHFMKNYWLMILTFASRVRHVDNFRRMIR